MSAPDLLRRCTAELVGTAMLVGAVVGSGIMATRLTPDDVGLQLLYNSLATGGVLAALILALQPVSAAFNPAVTLAEAALGGVPLREVPALVAAQVVGGCLGAVVANLMFELPAVSVSATQRDGAGQYLAEVVATLGLVLLIFLCVRSGREHAVAYAVAGWITAAYWFTSSTSFANPAVTVGRTLSDTFAGIAPASAPAFVGLQVVGAGLAVLLIRFLRPVGPHPTADRVDTPADPDAAAGPDPAADPDAAHTSQET